MDTKYERVAEVARVMTEGEAVVLVVLNGKEDSGFRGGGSHPVHEGGPSGDEDSEQGENVNATTKDD